MAGVPACPKRLIGRGWPKLSGAALGRGQHWARLGAESSLRRAGTLSQRVPHAGGAVATQAEPHLALQGELDRVYLGAPAEVR